MSRLNTQAIRKINYFLLYSAVTLLIYFFYQLSQPIRLADTDMWYHLNAGRFFWEHFEIPNTTFFSFIQPEREWTNYYWGFQSVIHQFFDLWGYYGLVTLRALLAAGTLTLVTAYFYNSLKFQKPAKPVSWQLPVFFILLGLVIITFDQRVFQLRPHLFSYLFIISFIYILASKPKATPLLPFLTVLWANTHGIEWPVGALICGSFALPLLIKIIRKQPLDQDRGYKYLAFIFLCIPAFFINPHGWELLLAPFNVPNDVYKYTIELKPFNLTDITSVNLGGEFLTRRTATSLLFIISLILLIRGLVKKILTLPEILLYAGGSLLLIRGHRFIWEWLLLSTPLLASVFRNNSFAISAITESKFIRHILVIAILAIPFTSLYSKTSDFGIHPFDKRDAPVNIPIFLKHINASGNILAPPSHAGYIEWSLYPEFLTFIDMQYPPFIPADFIESKTAYSSKAGMQKFIDKYEPDWILTHKGEKIAELTMSQIDLFRPVFTDDAQVLYANRKKHPEITEKYEMKLVNPHALTELTTEDIDAHIQELKKLLQIAPQIHRVNHALAKIYFDKGEFVESLKYAAELIKYSPLNPNGYLIAGNSLQNLGYFDKAINMYKAALNHSEEKYSKMIYLYIAKSLYSQEDFSSAYNYFKKSINPYKESFTPDELYYYAFSAVITGELEHAKRLLNMSLFLANGNTDKKIRTLAENLLTQIKDGKYDSPSVGEWLISLIDG